MRRDFILKAHMKFITGLDIETTGIGEDHRIIELCATAMTTSGKPVPEYSVNLRFNPKRAIDPKAQAVHHISLAELMSEPTWEEKASEIRELLAQSSLIVIHNAAFDAPFISRELARVGQKPVLTPTYCTMRASRWATFDGKVPRLGELCFALGVEYDASQAHGAEYDVAVMLECFKRIAKQRLLSNIYIKPFNQISEAFYLAADGFAIDNP